MVVRKVDLEVEPRISFSFSRKHVLVFFILLAVLILVFAIIGVVGFVKSNLPGEIKSCGDGTFYETCSLNKPYYCLDGQLIESPTVCGCPDNFEKLDGGCFSSYESGEKLVELNYFLDSERNEFDFLVYDSMNSYLSGLKQSINYFGGEASSRADFKLNKVNDDLQRDFLLPLVVEIQNFAPNNKDDQARIAISLVQNIPFGSSNETIRFGESVLNYSRYPYQVLYDNEGVCGEKTELLLFLLRDLGYGTAFFYFQEENHEALGIKCPVEKSYLETGYCFVETTGSAIITDDGIEYVDIGKLYSSPEVFLVSEGRTFGEKDFYEFGDARKLKNIREASEKMGVGFLKKRTLKKLTEKYGLVEEYYSSG